MCYDDVVFCMKVLEYTYTFRYTFYDGPPFATGLPHYGHTLAVTIKCVCTCVCVCVCLSVSVSLCMQVYNMLVYN